MNRVIFCDYDGVLNDPVFLLSNPQKAPVDFLDPAKVNLLSCLCARTQAKVVLTSTWKNDPKAKKYLESSGIEVLGTTPDGEDRGQEINQWIKEQNFKGDYVILDDECSGLDEEQESRLVYTRERDKIGLSFKHILFAESLFRSDDFESKASEEFINCILEAIENDWLRVMWNIHQEEYANKNPWENTGNVEGYKNDTFEVHAYDWSWDYDDSSDLPQPYNFKWGDLEICWYKWCGRGISTNRPTTHDELALMLKECLASLRKEEREHDEFYG